MSKDVISRAWLKGAIHNFYHGLKHTPTEEDIQAYIDAAPPVTPKQKNYKVVRTFDDGAYEAKLQEAFNDGYEFVRASEYVPETTHNGCRRYGYIEYILAKEESEKTK